jgi:DNA topoisomerase VI subunit A
MHTHTYAYTHRISARYILVVEKDCIFQRLTEDRLHERLPIVLVTAKGQPDLATRAFLSRREGSWGIQQCVGEQPPENVRVQRIC